MKKPKFAGFVLNFPVVGFQYFSKEVFKCLDVC